MLFVTKISQKILSLLLVCTLFSCAAKKEDNKMPQNKRPAPRVEGYVIKTEAYAETIESPGTIVANEVTDIHPEISGRIISLNVREGQFVTKGTLLAKLYDADLQAQLRKSQSQLSIAKVNEDRAAQLLRIQGISKQDYDNSLLTVRNIEADINIIKTDISRTEVRAPFSGKMGLKDVSVGAYVTPSGVLATINQVSTLKIDFTVPEKYISRISIGQIVTFTTESTGNTYSAKVMATESNVATSNRSLTARAVITGNTQGLVPGAFAKVTIDFAPNANAIFVPSQAIIPTAKGKQVALYINGVARFNNVETGIRDSARVEVVSGLKPGDTILTTGLMAVKDGAKVDMKKVQ